MAIGRTVKTGERCQESGDYRSDCPDRISIPLAIHNVAPPCRNCRRSVTWTLYRLA